LLAGVLLFVVSMAWSSAPARAHALLAESTPADGDSMDEPPKEVLLTFTEAPDPELTTVRLLDASGTQLEAGKVEMVPGQPAKFRVPLGTLAQGAYTLTWRTTSPVDGHTTVGAVAFGVGVPVASATVDPTAVRYRGSTALSILARWLFYVGVVVLLGGAVVGTAVVSDPRAIWRWGLTAAWAATAVGVLLTVTDQRANAQTSLSVLLSSSTGGKLIAQGVAVVLAGIAVGWACSRPSRLSIASVGVGAAAAMLARALAGHADASSVRWFTVGMQWIHLVAAGAWVGGLLWLLVAMRRGDPGRGSGLARRFSAVAAGTLAVVVVSGSIRALDEVGAWSRLVNTSFGVALVVKLGLVAALIGLGARSRFRHVPEAAAGYAGGLRRVVRGEVAIAAGVLGATAVLAGLPPSASVAAASKTRPAATVTASGSDYATSVRVRLVADPGLPGPNRFDVTVEDHDSGKPVPAQSVTLRFQLMEKPDLAPAVLELARDSDSHWRGSGRALSIDGRWSVTANVQLAEDAVEVPMEVVTRRPATASTPAAGASATAACGSGKPNPAYSLAMTSDPDPPRAERTIFHLTVRRDDKPVTGAKVCLIADMPDMRHPALSKVATEVSGGTYDAEFRLGMGGTWVGSVIVAEPGQPTVSLPVRFFALE
jgi:copper transport protein